MKVFWVIFLFFIITPSSFAQINYEKGYFINNNNERTECLIRNVDWKNNPKKFQYKLTDEGKSETAEISAVSEFGIYNHFKYIRAKVKIDRSPTDISELSHSPNPEYSNEVLFLKVLIEGSASLYMYEDKSMVRFFYNLKDTPIEQLIYKEFFVNESHISENASFRKELSTKVNCNTPPVEHLDYTQKDLEKYFRLFNFCSGDAQEEIVRTKKEIFHLRVLGGLNMNWFKMMCPTDPGFNLTSFPRKTNFKVGLQLEALFPFNRNKWSLLLDADYNYVRTSQPTSFGGTAVFDSKFVEFPIGIRHYFFINKDASIFINAQYNSNFLIHSTKVYLQDYNPYGTLYLKIDPNPSFVFGTGATYKRFSAEFRYSSKLNMLHKNVFWRSNLTRLSFLIGFKLF